MKVDEQMEKKEMRVSAEEGTEEWRKGGGGGGGGGKEADRDELQ